MSATSVCIGILLGAAFWVLRGTERRFWVTVGVLAVLAVPALSQNLSTERKIRIKTYDPQNAEASILFTGRMAGKDRSLSFTAGYGQTLTGGGFYNAKSALGVFGSGLMHSEMSSAATRLGADYLTAIRDFGWGSNGLNMSFDGKMGKFAMGGSYSGYLNAFSLNFDGTVGTFTGRGVIIGRDGTVERLQADMEVRF